MMAQPGSTRNWFTISDASHFIEMDWRAATAVGANNGGLTLWIDGTQQANLTGVDNDTRRIDRARLGALTGMDTGTTRHLLLRCLRVTPANIYWTVDSYEL